MTVGTITAVGCGTPEPPEQPTPTINAQQILIERGTYLLEYSHLVIEDLICQRRIADATQLQSRLDQSRTDFTLALAGVLTLDVVVATIDAAIDVAERARQKREVAQ